MASGLGKLNPNNRQDEAGAGRSLPPNSGADRPQDPANRDGSNSRNFEQNQAGPEMLTQQLARLHSTQIAERDAAYAAAFARPVQMRSQAGEWYGAAPPQYAMQPPAYRGRIPLQYGHNHDSFGNEQRLIYQNATIPAHQARGNPVLYAGSGYPLTGSLIQAPTLTTPWGASTSNLNHFGVGYWMGGVGQSQQASYQQLLPNGPLPAALYGGAQARISSRNEQYRGPSGISPKRIRKRRYIWSQLPGRWAILSEMGFLEGLSAPYNDPYPPNRYLTYPEMVKKYKVKTSSLLSKRINTALEKVFGTHTAKHYRKLHKKSAPDKEALEAARSLARWERVSKNEPGPDLREERPKIKPRQGSTSEEALTISDNENEGVWEDEEDEEVEEEEVEEQEETIKEEAQERAQEVTRRIQAPTVRIPGLSEQRLLPHSQPSPYSRPTSFPAAPMGSYLWHSGYTGLAMNHGDFVLYPPHIRNPESHNWHFAQYHSGRPDYSEYTDLFATYTGPSAQQTQATDLRNNQRSGETGDSGDGDEPQPPSQHS